MANLHIFGHINWLKTDFRPSTGINSRLFVAQVTFLQLKCPFPILGLHMGKKHHQLDSCPNSTSTSVFFLQRKEMSSSNYQFSGDMLCFSGSSMFLGCISYIQKDFVTYAPPTLRHVIVFGIWIHVPRKCGELTHDSPALYMSRFFTSPSLHIWKPRSDDVIL